MILELMRSGELRDNNPNAFFHSSPAMKATTLNHIFTEEEEKVINESVLKMIEEDNLDINIFPQIKNIIKETMKNLNKFHRFSLTM